jgi:hypothetical protein
LDPTYAIFYESQSGGLCRLHSLNAFFGQSKISPESFQEYIIVYDKYLKERFNVDTSSASFDLINSDQTNIVSFILKQFKTHVRYYALNTLYGKSIDAEIESADFIFIYNACHIWGIRKKNGQHYSVDSMGGVRPFNIGSLRDMRDIGLLVPVSLKDEWDKKVNMIDDILDKESIKNRHQLCLYLKKLHDEKKILVGVAMSILETNMVPCPEFKRIQDLVNKYNSFITIFTRGNYSNLKLILDNIPDIIFGLTSLHQL